MEGPIYGKKGKCTETVAGVRKERSGEKGKICECNGEGKKTLTFQK